GRTSAPVIRLSRRSSRSRSSARPTPPNPSRSRSVHMGFSPQDLADRAEIQDVIVRYGWAIDTKDWALLDTCFTADAEVDYSSNPGGKKGPYSQIRSWLEKMISAFPVTQHLMSNIDVTL